MDEAESVADDELLYRRIPASTDWYDPGTGELDDQAFAPHKDRDLTGLSLYRAIFKTIEETAAGQPGKSYYVATLRARDIRAAGIEITRDDPGDPGHVVLPSLNGTNRKDDRTLKLQRVLAGLPLSVSGPFPP
jgi:hypothetical protein